MGKALGVALAACLLATGCSSKIDEEAWRADVESEAGAAVADWQTYRDTWMDVCDEDDTGFRTFIAVALDDGDSLNLLRANVRHACPDRLQDLETLRDDLTSLDAACDTPASERTAREERLAEAMGC